MFDFCYRSLVSSLRPMRRRHQDVSKDSSCTIEIHAKKLMLLSYGRLPSRTLPVRTCTLD
jgi:hypothetical protein